MKYTETQQKSLQELENMIKDLSIGLGKARFELANNTLKNTSVIKKNKKDVARILTLIKSNKIQSSKK